MMLPANGLSLPFNPERSFDFAKMAYAETRSEVLSRLEVREKFIEIYLVGSITVLVALLSLSQEFSIPIEAYAVSPILSLIVAIQVGNQVRAIEALCEFIRHEINDHLIRCGAWAPHWDWHTRQGRVESQKTGSRILAHWIAIHTPTAVSLVIYTHQIRTMQAVWSDWATYCLSLIIFAVAIEVSRRTYAIRTQTAKRIPKSPDWWQSSMKQSEGKS